MPVVWFVVLGVCLWFLFCCIVDCVILVVVGFVGFVGGCC